MEYQPPCTITPSIVYPVAEIGETIGRNTVLSERNMAPRLRRENRIRTIQASLTIENNTLTLEQVTAVIEGKRVLGHPREIHPFADGNGRMGRLWQTLILRNWKPLLVYLPVETVIRDRREECCRVLAVADQQADATPFIEFMLGALRDAVREAVSTDQAGDHVTDQVAALIRAIGGSEPGSINLMQASGLSHRPTFRSNYLNPALKDEWIGRTQPDSTRSPTQRYRLTVKGQNWLLYYADDL